KPLAAMGRDRYADLPNVMTLGEAGASAGDFVTFQGIIAPRGTPQAAVTSTAMARRTAAEARGIRQKDSPIRTRNIEGCRWNLPGSG
ncbi:MAG TPA: tripartite tricarboxylate transporter substrate-binding protein, partial [Candidatus Omnitrophota bacterium]|nr:tripartite tricarboxylate transporter substrate-binding protein [Candidatus Omnitrophota bacterium]